MAGHAGSTVRSQVLEEGILRINTGGIERDRLELA
jgi:hypothetical protein